MSDGGGVNLVGYLRTESGVGSAARGYARALRAAGVPVALRDVSRLQVNRAEDRGVAGGTDDLYGVNLVCADVELHYAILSYLGEDFFRDRYTVGIWAWEQTSFPRKWYDRFAYYDEVWVGTSFISDALAPVSPVPVVRVPPALDVETPGDRDSGRRQLGVGPGEFVFLFVFDFHSHAARKNPLAAVEAFARAFAPTEPARLVLKCVNEQADPATFDLLRRRAAGHNVAIHAGYWPAGEVRDLMAACDAYVSLHRAEGTGLTVSDAMALGKPVVATGWSGNTDFMTVANSFPVAYELVPLAGNVGPYQAGELWAEPSVEHAAELMRRVFEDRQLGVERGRAARRTIEAEFSAAAVGRLIRQRLDAIALRRRFGEFRAEVHDRFRRYQQLPARLREAVEAAVPAGATVAVVSKGDSELVDLGERRGWHFPQDDGGGYAGYYPGDGAAAVAHLEVVRARGAEFLLLPRTAFWWLDRYPEFRRHLESHYHFAHGDEDCVVYRLAVTAAGEG